MFSVPIFLIIEKVSDNSAVLRVLRDPLIRITSAWYFWYYRYDHDVRIHNLVRGPGVAPGSTFAYLGTNVDQAPAWLGLAGLPTPARMDGRSYVVGFRRSAN